MHTIDLIAKALSEEESPSPETDRMGICCVTGAEGPVVKRKDLIGSSFTDGALLARPDSKDAGVNAYRVLKYRPERTSSWWADGKEFKKLTRVEVRAAVFADPPDGPWAGYATTSYKKHGAMRAPVNGPGKAVWLFETRLVDCSDRGRMNEWWKVLNDALRGGIGRSIIETLDCPTFVMGKVGLSMWMDFERWARDKCKSALYAFLCYLLPSQEELKAEAADEKTP